MEAFLGSVSAGWFFAICLVCVVYWAMNRKISDTKFLNSALRPMSGEERSEFWREFKYHDERYYLIIFFCAWIVFGLFFAWIKG
jgi:hypothetical protein